MKKIIAILLIALMMVALVPTSVFADVSIEEYMNKHIMNFWESNVYIQTAEEVNLRNMPCSEKTNSNSKILVVLPKNSYLTTTGIFQNNQYNLWYRVLYNGQTYYTYINSTNFPAHWIIGDNGGSLTIENLQFPEVIVRGEEFSISGIVKNPYASLDWIHTGLTDSEGNVIHGHSADIRALNGIYEYNFSGSSFERQLSSLNELEPGDYSLNIYVRYKYNYVHSEDNKQIIRSGVSSDIKYPIKFTVIDPHTCIFSPGSIRSPKHPHNYIGECSVCGELKELEGTGFFRTAEVIVKEPTCTSEGRKATICEYGLGKEKCGAVLKTGKIEKLEHIPVETPKGIVCEVCNALLVNIVNPHRHIYIFPAGIEDEHPHRTIKKCNRCEDISYADDSNYELVEKTTPSTCTVYGMIELLCSVCGEVEQSTPVELAPHTITVINKTETYSGDEYCTVCEQIIAPGNLIGHICSFESTGKCLEEHPHLEILECSCGKVDYGDGIFETTTVNQSPAYTGDEICLVCGYVAYGETIPHECSFETTARYREEHPHNEIFECEFCGDIIFGEEHFETKVINKSDTYTGDTVCEVCGELIEKGTEIETGEYKLGDVNNDGKINALDATQILRYANNKSSVISNMSDGEKYGRADVNGDGKVNALDATQILRYANNKSSVLERE